MPDPSTNSERAVQNRIIKLLHNYNGYEYIGNLKESENSNIREDLLRKFLTDKMDLTRAQAAEAIRKLKEAAFCANKDALYNSNKAVYNTLRYPVAVSQGAGLPNKQTWFIDWNDPGDNDFYIAEEVTVRKQSQGDEHRRPDVVIYVNGIALGVIELKKATVSVEDGINQNWRNQQEGQIPQFFSTMQLLMAGSESQGVYYGTTLTPPKFYLHWKEPAGEGYPYDNLKYPVSNSVYGQKEFPKSILMKRQKELQNLMDQTLEFKKDVKEMLSKAEKNLMAPVKQKLDEAVAAVAQEKALDYVINTAGNNYPYVNPNTGVDLTEQLKQSLGIK